MNKFLLLIIVVLTIGLLDAQHDPRARQALDAVSKKYSELGTLKVHYTSVFETHSTSHKSTTKGEILIKGNKYHLITPGQEVYNNGTTVWTYLKESKDVNITNNDPSEDMFNPARIFHLHKAGFKYKFVEDKVINGTAFEVIELNPEDIHSRYFKIRLEISKRDNLIHHWQVFERNGNKYSWTIDSFQSNLNVDDAHFNFEKSRCPDCKFIDLRN